MMDVFRSIVIIEAALAVLMSFTCTLRIAALIGLQGHPASKCSLSLGRLCIHLLFNDPNRDYVRQVIEDMNKPRRSMSAGHLSAHHASILPEAFSTIVDNCS